MKRPYSNISPRVTTNCLLSLGSSFHIRVPVRRTAMPLRQMSIKNRTSCSLGRYHSCVFPTVNELLQVTVHDATAVLLMRLVNN